MNIMEWQSKTILSPVLMVTMVACAAGAQSSAPLPEMTNLIRETIRQQRLAESNEQDYVFREDVGANKLTKLCTWAPRCPAPFGVPGVEGVGYRVISGWSRHFEVFWLDGIRVARILPQPTNNYTNDPVHGDWTLVIPTSKSQLSMENQRVNREIAEARSLRAQGKNPSTPDDPPQILLSSLLELCTFSNPRRQRIGGRSTILLDFAWNPALKPASTNETILKDFSGTVGIDEEDHAVQHLEGRFLANVKLDDGNIKIRKGTRVTIANRRVDAGIWLLSKLDAWGEGRYFAFALQGEGSIVAGNYLKFHTASRILPGYIEVPSDSPASSTPKSPR